MAGVEGASKMTSSWEEERGARHTVRNSMNLYESPRKKEAEVS